MKAKIVFLFLLIAQVSFAQNSASSGYNQPPKEILDIIRAPSPPSAYLSPTEDRLILIAMQDYPSIERVATPFLRLAGVRLEPKNRSRHDTPGGYGIPSCARTLSIMAIDSKASSKAVLESEIKVDISKLVCAGAPSWSADGKHFYLKNRTETSVELWLGDALTGKIRRIPGVQLNPMLGADVQWMPDQKHLLVKLVPKNQGPPPVASVLPLGPSIQESKGQKGQSSTYEKRDTLNNKDDEKLFEFYASAQLAIVDIKNTKIRQLGPVGLYERVQVSPDGNHLLTGQILRPFSYLVTYERFPKKIEILDIAKLNNVSRHTIAELPLADRVPIHGVPMGPRGFFWHPHDPATLIWAEALDGGDWNVKVPERDKLMTLSAPFAGPAKEIFRTEQRYGGFQWFEDRKISFLNDYDENRHWERTFQVNFDNPQQAKKIIWDMSSDEEYANPGQPVYKVMKNGFWVIRQNKNFIYMEGAGASPNGDRPFLDKLDLETLKTTRLFRSDKSEYESFLSFIGDSDSVFLTRHQTMEEVPNVYRRTLSSELANVATGEAVVNSSRIKLTDVQDPTPQVRQIKKRLVKYKRDDGLDLSFTLYTPPGYKEGTRVPTILYAYPLDYADASKAGQVKGSQMTFTRLRGYRLLLMAGYAIIDNAAFPIVGDPKKAYDTYTEQLVADAKAAVDEAVRLGVADPDRIGVTGHSHGALMTVNLLAHSELFKAGVATSGSYNKTLTPFGFQNERRTLWEAPEVYHKVSPIFSADKLKTPLLIMHGADDANPGTTPMQASFLYEAVRSNGGTVRLVMLPHEPHWYSALESNEQQVYEMLRWFDTYVKGSSTGGAQH